MAEQLQLALPNDANQAMMSYYEILQIKPIVFDDHLVLKLQVQMCTKLILYLY